MNPALARRCENGASEACIDVERFEAADIGVGEFDHEAHVQVAWRYLQDTGLAEAIARYCTALERLTRKLGAQATYHETITWFFMITVADRIARDGNPDWPAFKAANPDLITDARSLLARHYSNAHLNSELARRQFVLPDLAPVT